MARRMSPAGDNLDARLLRHRNDPRSEDWSVLANGLAAARRWREVGEVAEARMKVAPRELDPVIILAQSWIARGDLLRAQKVLIEGARAHGKEPRVYRWLGEVLLKRGDPERAKKVLSKAKALAPADGTIASLHQRAERLSRIADDAETSIREPDDDRPTAERAITPPPEARRSAPEPRRPPPPVAKPPPRRRPPPSAPPISLDLEDEEPTTVGADLSQKLIRAMEDAKSEPPPPEIDDDSPTSMMSGLDVSPPLFENDDPFPPLDHTPPKPVSSKSRGAPDPFGDPLPAPPPVASPAPSPVDAFPPAAPEPEPEPEPFPAPLASPVEPFPASPAFPVADAPVERAPDPPASSAVGTTEDVDGLLDMMRREGLFEPPDDAPTAWAPRKSSKQRGTKVALPLGIMWGVGVALAVGGYFGWSAWVDHQEEQAAVLVEEADAAALRGDHGDLVDAERTLRQARELHPLGVEGPKVLLFVHAQRALEDGSFEPGYLRPALEKASQLELESPLTHAAEAVLQHALGRHEEGDEELEHALEAGAEDPRVLYIVGRLEQRSGGEDALEHLATAYETSPQLSAAGVALAEARADEGQLEEARSTLEAVLQTHPDHLRATLWSAYLQADDDEPEAGLARVEALEERLELGAPTDLVLSRLTAARLLRRLGRREEAREKVEEAARAGATEPRLQALVARAAQALGGLRRAQQAASAAVSGAPGVPDYRKLLAEIMVERRDGVGALRVLGQLSNDDPDVLRLSAQAAILVGGEDALNAAAEALDAHLEEQEEPSVEMRAIRIRIGVQQGQAREMLRAARELAASAPGDPIAALALGEAALEARDPDDAIEALERVVAAAPQDADGHYLLGRAQRMAADGEAAEESFRAALELQPGHSDASVALGYLLLDLGEYDAADELYQELSRRAGRAGTQRLSILGRLGRIEALLGKGAVDDAKVQLEGLRREDRERAAAQVVAARVALADERPGEAVQTLRPMANAEGASADILALYGRALLAAYETTAAREVFERAIDQDRGHPESLLGLGELFVRAGDERDALEELDAAERSLERRIRPPQLRARLLTLRGRALLERDSERAAIRALEAASEIEGAPPETFFYLGEALAGERSADARAAYERYLELAPEGPLARRARRAIR